VDANDAAAMIAEVKKLPGAIGYADLRLAMEAKVAYPQLQNLFGRFVQPEAASVLAAAAAVDWTVLATARNPSFELDLTDMPGLRSWPIVATTYVALPRERTRMTVAFLDWSMSEEGDRIADQLGFVGLPSKGKQYVRATLRRGGAEARSETAVR
jgi:phosphate transport system substrate-binding protein